MKLFNIQLDKLFKQKNFINLSQKKHIFIEVKNLGPVGFKRSYRAKRLILKIKEDKQILVSVPRGISLEIAMNFLISKTKWVNNTLNKISLKEQQKKNLKDKIILINREKAKKIITNRVKFLAGLYDFAYNKIAIKNQKTIWGSCSSKNNLNFNYKIASLPKHLMDYVILHELMHTEIKDHSKLFWNTLDKYVSDSKSLRKELKSIHFSI